MPLLQDVKEAEINAVLLVEMSLQNKTIVCKFPVLFCTFYFDQHFVEVWTHDPGTVVGSYSNSTDCLLALSSIQHNVFYKTIAGVQSKSHVS